MFYCKTDVKLLKVKGFIEISIRKQRHQNEKKK